MKITQITKISKTTFISQTLSEEWIQLSSMKVRQFQSNDNKFKLLK